MTEIIGRARTYAELRGLLAERRKSLGLRQLEVDDLAGLQGGYTGKLEVGIKNYGDMSLDAMTGALEVELAVMRRAPAHGKSPDSAMTSLSAAKLARKLRGAKGGRATARNMSPKQRRAAARKAAVARWTKYRASMKSQKTKARRGGIILGRAGDAMRGLS